MASQSHHTTPVQSHHPSCAGSPSGQPQSSSAAFSAAFQQAFGGAGSSSQALGTFSGGTYRSIAGSTLPQHQPDLTELTQLVGEMMLALKTVVDQVQDLTNIVQMSATIPATKTPKVPKDVVACPKAWTGKGGSAKARHFLAAFHNWASAQGEGLNTYDSTTGKFHIHDSRWIAAVLNLMEEDAHTWALPNLEELGRGKYPLNGKWTNFEVAFKARFMPQDAQESAQEAMKNLKQGKHTVAEYMSQFDQYTMQTGWSDKDHQTRFYNGLSEKIKDAMAITARPIGTLQELREHAVILDQCIRKRDAEKKGQTFSYNTTTTRDPNAMDVMTTHDYDSDANFFAYYFPITTPVPLSPCTITVLVVPLFLFHPSPCTLITVSPLTAWLMTHSDASGCATSLFQDLLPLSI